MTTTARLLRLERACPCGHCAAARTDERPGWRQRAPAEALAVHDAHTAALLALWHVSVWAPEERAYRVALLAIARTARAWRALQLARLADRLRRRRRPDAARPALAHWLEVCPSTGPPAGGDRAGAPVI